MPLVFSRKWVVRSFGLVLVLFFIGWVVFSGKDLNWDALNYHIYSAYSLVNNRLSHDFMPASIQSYFNPLAYIPFYIMVVFGFHSMVIAVLLTLLHSFIFVLLYFVCVRVVDSSKNVGGLIASSILLALSTSLWWGLVGSSFIDLVVAIPVLGAIVFCLKGKVTHQFYSGFLMGMATALKLSCAVFAIAGLVWCFHRSYKLSAKAVFLYGCGGVLGFVVFYGYWGYLLWSHFENPFFPYFNNIFESTYIAPEGISVQRFTQNTISEFFLFPFKMALPAHWIYSESINPDVKPLVVWLVSFVLMCALGLGRIWDGVTVKLDSPSRKLVIFWLFSFIGWQITTSNGRYAIVLLLLSGPVIAVCVNALWKKKAILVCGVILAVQLAAIYAAGVPRWSSEGWTREWYSFDVPDRLNKSPALYFSLGPNSMSFLALKLHPDSSYVNISGQYSLSLEQLKKGKSLGVNDDIRTLLPFELGVEQLTFLGEPAAAAVYTPYQNAILGRFGYAVTDECEFIKQTPMSKSSKIILSCKIAESALALNSYRIAVKSVESVYANVEKQCSKLLSPSGGVIEEMSFGWQKFYVNTDTKLKIIDGKVLLQKTREMFPIHLGSQLDNSAETYNIPFVEGCL